MPEEEGEKFEQEGCVWEDGKNVKESQRYAGWKTSTQFCLLSLSFHPHPSTRTWHMNIAWYTHILGALLPRTYESAGHKRWGPPCSYSMLDFFPRLYSTSFPQSPMCCLPCYFRTCLPIWGNRWKLSPTTPSTTFSSSNTATLRCARNWSVISQVSVLWCCVCSARAAVWNVPCLCPGWKMLEHCSSPRIPLFWNG